jgi:DMSO/TMAO reductase YedYZ molybdopterin-dependent catalytic subunit
MPLLGGALLHPGHGYPVRLTAPTNPGVVQTKWLQAGDRAVSDQPPALRWWWAGPAVGGAIGLFGLAGLLAAAGGVGGLWRACPFQRARTLRCQVTCF